MHIVGTHHYATAQQAKAAYGDEFADAITEGRIEVGKPEVKEDHTLMVDNDGRYHIADVAGFIPAAKLRPLGLKKV